MLAYSKLLVQIGGVSLDMASCIGKINVLQRNGGHSFRRPGTPFRVRQTASKAVLKNVALSAAEFKDCTVNSRYGINKPGTKISTFFIYITGLIGDDKEGCSARASVFSSASTPNSRASRRLSVQEK
jgi:hypothetical protein